MRLTFSTVSENVHLIGKAHLEHGTRENDEETPDDVRPHWLCSGALGNGPCTTPRTVSAVNVLAFSKQRKPLVRDSVAVDSHISVHLVLATGVNTKRRTYIG